MSKFKDITVKIAACVLIMLCFLIPGSLFSQPVALPVGAVLVACYVTVLYFMNGVVMGVRVHDFGVELNKRKGKSRVPKKTKEAPKMTRSIFPHNKAIKVVPGLWPSTGRPCQGAVYCWR